MLYDLLHRDISAFDPRDVPLTDALHEQQIHSLDSLRSWWLTVLDRGFVWKSRQGCPDFQEWTSFYATELLWRSYLQWCDETRINRRQTREEMGKLLTNAKYPTARPRTKHPIFEIDTIDVDNALKHGDSLNEHAIVHQEHPRGYLVGSLAEARDLFSTICPTPAEWAEI